MHRHRLRPSLLTLAALLAACDPGPQPTDSLSAGPGETDGASTGTTGEPSTGGPPTTGAGEPTTGAPSTGDADDPPASTGSTGEPDDIGPVSHGRICVLDGDGLPPPYASLTSPDPAVEIVSDVKFEKQACFNLTAPAGSVVVARAKAPGYIESGAVLPLGDELRVGLIRLAQPPYQGTFAAGAPAELKAGPVTVSIPANAVIDPQTKQPYAGNYKITVLPIDPTKDLALAPGPLVGLDLDAQRVALESYMMADVSLWRENDQTKLELDPKVGATLVLAIPKDHPRYATLKPGQSYPAWSYDLDAGEWVQAASPGSIMQATEGLAWVVHVPHFTYWNFDVPVEEKECVHVTVKVKDGNMYVPVSDSVPVTLQGIAGNLDSYAGFNTAYTDKMGEACVEMPLGRTGTLWAGVMAQKLAGSTEEVVEGTGVPSNCADNPGPGQPVTIYLEQGVCAKDDTQSCFSYGDDLDLAPPSQCTAGTKECLIQFWSDCIGQMGPAPAEDCGTMLDDDCKGGLYNGCEGDLCEPGKDDGQVCTDGKPDYYFDFPLPSLCHTGLTNCPGNNKLECIGVQVPQAELQAPDDEDCNGWPAKDMVIAHLSGSFDQTILDVAASANDVYVTGLHEAPITIGGVNIPHTGGTEVFVLRLGHDLVPKNGASVARLPGGSASGPRIAVDGDGKPYLVGTCSTGGVKVGGTVAGCLDAGQAFFAAMATDLSNATIGVFGGANLRNLDIGATKDELFIGGDAGENFDFLGAKVMVDADGDAFVLSYDKNKVAGAVVLPGMGVQEARRLVVREANNSVFLAGSFSGTIAVGMPALSAQDNLGNVYVAQFDPATDTFVAVAGVLGAGDIDTGGLAVAADGRVVVAGTFEGSIVQAGAAPLAMPLQNDGPPDIFVARFALAAKDPAPEVRGFGAPSVAVVNAVALAGADVLVTGAYRDQLDFGGQPLNSPAAKHGFVVAFDGDVAGLPQLWTRDLDAAKDLAAGRALAVAGGHAFLAASFTGTLDLDSADPVNPKPELDSVVVRFATN